MDIEEWKVTSTKELKNCCLLSIRYTHIWDQIINYCLREKFITSYTLDIFSSILRAMNQSIPIPLGTKLYRGMNINLTNLEKKDYGFTSFSLSYDIAKNFATKKGIILSYQVNNENLRGIFFSKKFSTSKYDEEEILLGPGLEYHIIKVSKYDDYKIVDVDVSYNSYKAVSLDYRSEIDVKFNYFLKRFKVGFHFFYYPNEAYYVITFPKNFDYEAAKIIRKYNMERFKFVHFYDLTYRENFDLPEVNSWGMIYVGYLKNKYFETEIPIDFLINYMEIHKVNYEDEKWDYYNVFDQLYRKIVGKKLSYR